MAVVLPAFQPQPGVSYKHDYHAIFRAIEKGELPQIETLRFLILNDLFFVVYFCMEIPEYVLPKVNRKFIVDRCREVEDGPEGRTLDLWARYHFKTTIRTARLIQRVLKWPEKTHLIASYNRPTAKKFLRPLKMLFEKGELLKACFPEVLYDRPEKQSPKWSEDEGIIVKRKSVTRRESTVEAWGVIEGMPTGSHFDFIDVDDLETKDTVRNPEVAGNVNDSFDLLFDLLTEGGHISVWGTPYSHLATYFPFIFEKKNAKGKPAFLLRKYPATDDGTREGKPVMLTQDEWDDICAIRDPYILNCQHLINPTPIGSRKLNPEGLQEVDIVPNNLVKFMVIDPAGDDTEGKNTGNAWAIMLFGVEEGTDEIGASKIFVVDMALKPMGQSEATETAARMYLAGGIIHKVGIEKTGLSTAEVHLANALRARGRYISQEGGNLVILKPRSREKAGRIIDALAWPLDNAKWFVSRKIALEYRERLRTEIERFPFYHPDGLDAMAYLYDLIKDWRFDKVTNTVDLQTIDYGAV